MQQSSSQAVSASPFANGLTALYVVAFLSGLSLGLFNPFISTLMAENQVSDLWIGANSTVYFLAIALGTPLVAKSLRRFGLRRTMMTGFVLIAAIAPLFPQTQNLALWFVIRAAMGLSICLYLISGQTALNYFCIDANRSIVNGLDALSFSLGFGLGPVIGAMAYEASPQTAFNVGSLIIASGLAVVYFGLPEKTVRFNPMRLSVLRKIRLPLQGGFAYGFAVATLVSLYPVYLLRQNQGVDQIGYTFGAFILGGLLATIPLTHLADRTSKITILIGGVAVAIVALYGLTVTNQDLSIKLLAFIAGAGMSPVFPLSLALIGAKLPPAELPSGSGLFTAIYSVGCTAGPLLSSVLMQYWGDRHIFSFILIILIVFMVLLLKNRQSIHRHQH